MRGSYDAKTIKSPTDMLTSRAHDVAVDPECVAAIESMVGTNKSIPYSSSRLACSARQTQTTSKQL